MACPPDHSYAHCLPHYLSGINTRYDPLSIEGSQLFGGRWNPKGVGVLYAISTPELGLVETLAHAPPIRYEELSVYWVFSIEVPDDIPYYRRDEHLAFTGLTGEWSPLKQCQT